jgi:hypothetical protein
LGRIPACFDEASFSQMVFGQMAYLNGKAFNYTNMIIKRSHHMCQAINYHLNGTACFKNINNCLNTNISLNLKVVNFFTPVLIVAPVATLDSYFPALVSRM